MSAEQDSVTRDYGTNENPIDGDKAQEIRTEKRLAEVNGALDLWRFDPTVKHALHAARSLQMWAEGDLA